MKESIITLLKRVRWRETVYINLFFMMAFMVLLYGICRVAFFLFNIEYFQPIGFNSFMYLMWGGIRFDLSALLYINILYLLFYLIPWHLRFDPRAQKIAKIWFIFSNAVGLLANVADFIYYRFTLRRTTVDVFKQFKQEENIGFLLLQFVVDYWYAVVVWAILILGLIKAYHLFRIKKQIFQRGVYYIVGVVGLLLASFFVVVGMRGGFGGSTRPITLSNAAKYVNDPSEISIVLNTPFAIFRTIGKDKIDRKKYFGEDELTSIYTPVHSRDTVQIFRNDNVVIFILESFSKEFIGVFNREKENGNYTGYTPFLDSLVQHSRSFTYSFSNGRKSIDGLPSVVSGIPALGVPYFLSPYSGNRINSVASLLGERGYHTSFFHGAPNGSMGFEAFVNIAGFEHYYGLDEYDNNDDFDGVWGIWDEKFFLFYADQLNTFSQPFISTLFSVSSHHPFRIPEEHMHRFKGGPKPIEKCIQYTDYALRRFFKRAKESSWFENTLFVFTADHCSSDIHFDESRTPVGLYSVPMIFYKPDNSLTGMDTSIVQQTDIMPSILSYLGYPEPYVSFGRNVFGQEEEPFAINYRENVYQLIQGDHLLLFDGEKSVGLYNFKLDKMITNNLLGVLPATQSKMERKVKAIIQQYNNRMIDDKLIP